MKYTCVFFLISTALYAQAPAFEAASIHPNRSDSPMSSIRMTAGHVSMTGVSLKKIILNAYGIPDDREYAIDGPAWLGSERYDLEATFGAGAQAAEVRQMLQTLLTERFHMTLHKETRKLPAYSLVIAKGGLKVKPTEPGQSRTSGGPGHFMAEKTSMQKFADLLAKQAGRPVADATGAAGVYDFTLDWSPAAALRMEPGVGDNDISIFTALQEQLGLRLESVSAPTDVLVIDVIERSATPN